MKSSAIRVAAAALFALGVTAAQADAISVYVGYADNLRASGFFPTTWLGDPNVVSQTPAGESLDTGAVRIDNNTGAAITVHNFTVTLANGVLFNIWSDLVIGAGQTGIFTQTASYNFDSSDYGIFGAFPPASLAPPSGSDIGGCSSSAAAIAAAGLTAACAAAIPVVAFDIGANAYSFSDTGHILDTGGWDFVNNSAYGGDGNESINWNVVGSAPVRGGNSVPEPGTLALVALALVGSGVARRRQRQ